MGRLLDCVATLVRCVCFPICGRRVVPFVLTMINVCLHWSCYAFAYDNCKQDLSGTACAAQWLIFSSNIFLKICWTTFSVWLLHLLGFHFVHALHIVWLCLPFDCVFGLSHGPTRVSRSSNWVSVFPVCSTDSSLCFFSKQHSFFWDD